MKAKIIFYNRKQAKNSTFNKKQKAENYFLKTKISLTDIHIYHISFTN